MTTEDKNDGPVVTPVGIIAYPFLSKPDVGRANSSGKYTVRLYITKDEWKKSAKPLVEAVRAKGRDLKGKDVTLKEFKHPIYDVEKLEEEKRNKLPEQLRTGYMFLNCAGKRQPIVKDASLNTLSNEDIDKIRGGDHCRLVLQPYTYPQQGGGVALGLNIVQYKCKGEFAIGGGSSGAELLTEMEGGQALADPTGDEPATPKGTVAKAAPKDEDFDDF